MGTLLLVRHGQASFGAADYDRLSPLGARQCRHLGEHFRARGLTFEAVLTGTLRRHAQSLAAIAEGLGGGLPHALAWPGLDEYDSEALIRAHHPQPLPSPHDAEGYKLHFRLLREALLRWMEGSLAPQGMPDHPTFNAGVAAALEHVRSRHRGLVLVVSSGGPISHAVGQVLGTPPATTVELNLRIRNSAVTEFAFSPKRHSLVSFNTVPHLERPDREDCLTYA
jgi:broad specificity phosphatase PhoE